MHLSPLVKWTLVLTIIIFAALTIFRLVFFLHFHTAEYTFANCTDSFFLGARFDIRSTCIITLPLLLFGSMQLSYRTDHKKLTLGSILLLVFTCVITVVIIMIMKNNKAGIINIGGLLFLFFLLITFLLTIKDLNPFRNRNAKRIWITYLFLFLSLITVLYIFDFQHFDYLHQRLNASVLNYTQDAKISFNMVWQTYPVIKILIVILITMLLSYLLIVSTFKNSYRKTYNVSSLSSMFTIMLIIVMALGIFGRFSQYPLRWSDAFSFGDDFKANLSLNPMQSFFSSLQYTTSDKNNIKNVRAYYGMISQYLGVKDTDSVSLNFTRKFQTDSNSKQPSNVIIVICESFSAYKSSMYGNPLNTTPFFNSLSKQGVFFDRCFTPAYGTARGVWAVVTGIPDVENPNTASRNPAIVDQHSIINDMKGYEKYYFLGGSTSWANIRGLLTNNIEGLHLYEEGSYKAKSVDVWGISDKHLFLEANGVLKDAKKPFFAIIQTSDNHRPYTIPSEDRGTFKIVSYPSDTLKKYGFSTNEEMNAFRYTDFCYEQFITAAKKETYFSNTLFVFVGDHGIRGDAGNMFPRCWTDFGVTTQHVPLLFYYPNRLEPKRTGATCSQVDILPSVASLIHMPYYNIAMGRNLFDSSKDINVRFPNHAFLFDPDVNQIGMMTDKYCFVKSLINGKERFASSVNNNPLESNQETMIDTAYIKKLTTGWYETAKYLLSHNKKLQHKN